MKGHPHQTHEILYNFLLHLRVAQNFFGLTNQPRLFDFLFDVLVVLEKIQDRFLLYLDIDFEEISVEHFVEIVLVDILVVLESSELCLDPID